MNLEFIPYGSIKNRAIKENISDKCIGILLHKYEGADWWIECFEHGLFVVDGLSTNDLSESAQQLVNFMAENDQEFNWIYYLEYMPRKLKGILLKGLEWEEMQANKIREIGFEPTYNESGTKLISLVMMTKKERFNFQLKEFIGESEIMLRKKGTNDVSEWLPLDKELHELLYGLIS